jgi:predicted deacylase
VDRNSQVGAPALNPPIEIAFPDLAPYAAGNEGTPYVWTFTNGHPGPHVLIQALTHGNEVCGAIAIDWLLREKIRPARGTLTLVFANVGAYLRFDHSNPFESRCVDEDFNRLWTREVLDGPRRSAELARARELRPIVDRTDHLLDLHSMSEPCLPLAMAGRQRKGVELAKATGVPQHIVIDSGHVAGQRLRDYAFFDDPADPRSALLVECGQHWEAAAPQVARQSLLRFLNHFGMLERGLAERHLDQGMPPPQRIVEVTATVTIVSEAFRFTQPVHGLQLIRRAGTVYAVDGGSEIRTPHDDCVLIMPTRKPKRGETAVRLGRFVS